LSVLEEGGVVHRHAFEGGGARFEKTHEEHHDHILDVDTGEVIEFQSDKIEQLQDEIARELGYDVVHHRLELYCRKKR
jgi:Fur family ferric uptake transcriptional regulator